MTSTHEQPTPLPPKVVIGSLATAVVTVLIVLLMFIFDGGDTAEEPARDAAETTATAPTLPWRTEAKPSASLEPVEGCAELDQNIIDELTDSLHDGEATVELSASWSGETTVGHQDAAALMVRSGAGTIDAPHLVWIRQHGHWEAATPETAAASTSRDASEETALTPGVSQAITCLTAGSR